MNELPNYETKPITKFGTKGKISNQTFVLI
jgi:hypothetical protein